MTVSRGYGVGEIYIPEGSNFVGKTILETQLQEQDVNVLTLYRGAKVIPNPRKDRLLEPEDKLLCFGRMEVMRGMVPAKTRKRRRPKVIDLPESVSGQPPYSDNPELK
ncbi:cation:proton antiporter regulatory subunit [Oleiphilus sp. HI0079]|uniref:cation:proton antiporter regulatory subunit n=1 Tax=unclassified Oleiphilus TaxID=2631174 RepID=UPI003516087A